MKCAQRNEADLERRRENRQYKESGLANVLLVNVEVSHCPSCGADLVSLPRLSKLHRLIALELIKKPARLTPAEVRFLRKSLGWSGADFARSLHVDASTVSRWGSETRSQEMSAANELLLRLAVAHGQRIEEYRVDDLSRVATGVPEAARIRLRATRAGWRREETA